MVIVVVVVVVVVMGVARDGTRCKLHRSESLQHSTCISGV